MKKIYFFAALAATLAMAGCSNEDFVNPTDPTNPTLGEGIVTIGLTNTTTRAARPLGSSAAANNVNSVKLVVLEKGDGNTYSVASGVSVEGATDGVISWTAPAGEAPSGNGHKTYKDVQLTGLAENATYKIVAYGYNAGTPGSAPDFTVNTTSDAAVFEVGSSSAAFTPEEIFAGTSDEFTTDTDGNFDTPVEVEMDRQVAGLLAYLTGIPTKLVGANGTLETVEQVVVYANAKSNGISFPSTEELNGKYPVTLTDNKTPLLTFDMSAIATNYKADATAQTDAKYTFNTINNNTVTATGTANQNAKPYAKEYTNVPADLTLKAGSIFGACFVLPYDAHKDSQTLTIELQNGAGTALKTLSVTTTEAPDLSEETSTTTAAKYAYDIRRNNFYSIGKKLATDNTTGDEEDDDEEEDPKPGDEDTPIDVSEENEIVLLINDSWDVLHNMGIE